jgi:Zn-dependent peptidase ImmA (M78 family)
MKRMRMADSPQHFGWLKALDEAATRKRLRLPPFKQAGMGTAVSREYTTGRIAVFKRRLVSVKEAQQAGVEWSLSQRHDDEPGDAVIFRESLFPSAERVAAVLNILHGWLNEQWPIERIEQAVAQEVDVRIEPAVPATGVRTEYWLSNERVFGIVVEESQWTIWSGRRRLSLWRSRGDGTSGGESLPLESLDRFCIWLARQWFAIAFGDVRPERMRELRAAAARAYEDVRLIQRNADEVVSAWWAQHAIRAADEELPNVFLERQADDIVISWDAGPAPSRFYSIRSGEEVLPVNFAIPVLRDLVRDRLQSAQLDGAERSHLLNAVSDDAEHGYALVSRYTPSVDKHWLNRHGFLDDDARYFGAVGTSRHPVIGLLRTSQDSAICAEDLEHVLALLEPSAWDSYEHLLEAAQGISTGVEVHEPWESGYRLASFIREKLGKSPAEALDVEQVARDLAISVADLSMSDRAILGVCVGSPAYVPMVILNLACPDANGPSGRRITIAHELCHLLFDRSRMLSLARFEGRGANSDRIIEMRANAFAVELLAPQSILIKPDGTVLADDELHAVSVQRQVSVAALSRHAENLRNRLRRR